MRRLLSQLRPAAQGLGIWRGPAAIAALCGSISPAPAKMLRYRNDNRKEAWLINQSGMIGFENNHHMLHLKTKKKGTGWET